MKRISLLTALVAISLSSFSQQNDLVAFEKKKASITKKSMMVLGGYSAANILVSAFATKTHNQEMRYFHQMNVQWNSINLVFAGLGYLGANMSDGKPTTLSGVLRRQNGTEKTYMLNMGLDVAYVAGGLYMTERSKSRANPAKLKGYGNCIMVQGGFLLLYDAVNYIIHNKHGKQLDKLLDKVQIGGAPGGLALVYNL
jgi:hypothetical protein